MKKSLTITYDYVTGEVMFDNNDNGGFTDVELLGLLEFAKVLLIEARQDI